MRNKRIAAGLVIVVSLIANLLYAGTDRELLVKRWKIVKHTKAGKEILVAPEDFIQLANDGIYEQTRNLHYSKGSWFISTDELTIRQGGEQVWKIVQVSQTSMSLTNSAGEQMDLEEVKMAAQADKLKSLKIKHLCVGKWKPNEHRKGTEVVKFLPADYCMFFPDGVFEKVVGGKYSQGSWSFNKEETELTIDGVIWKVESLSLLFFKIINTEDASEFMVLAKTR